MRRISLSFLPLLILAAGIVVGARAATANTTLSLVAYSTPKDAYAKIIPAFQGTSAGKGVSFTQSYGASGDQSRAVAAGLGADLVALSLAPDVSTLFKKVSVLQKSAREATQVFAPGKGDVLLTYENEAIYANKKGVHTEYVLPKQTILIENPVALTMSGLKHPEAKAFLKFLWSSKAQKLFGDTGYRPVLKSVARNAKYRFKQPKTLFKINSKALGLRGWKSVQFRFFNHDSGSMVKVIGHYLGRPRPASGGGSR